jgi:hypothetical protein
VKKGDLMVSAWLALSAAVITQVDFGALDFPKAKAKDKKAERSAPSLKNKCKGQADTPNGAREVAFCLAEKLYGWEGEELVALNNLWTWESGFSYLADNPNSTAIGIPQCLASMHTECYHEGWVGNPRAQVLWGLDYLQRYGSPSAAWAAHQSRCGTPEGCWY